VAPAGNFEITAITPGEGNGWNFGEAALRESLSLWEGVETFVDHAAPGEAHSLRDLGGICAGAAWDAQAGGVRLRLRTTGPSGALVERLAREWLAAQEPRPRLGFSADLLFLAHGREVSRILRVLSLDLVFNPARGGAFIRALNSIQDEEEIKQSGIDRKEKMDMQNNDTNQENAAAAAPAPTAAQLSARLLEATLTAAHLPAALDGSLRARFGGRVYDPLELDRAVDESRRLLADVQSSLVIAGPGRITGSVTGEERLQAAVDDLLGAPRESAMQGVKVERLSGIRELYLTLTGDVDLHGGYDPTRARLATTATMPGLVKNAMNKIITEQWEELGRAGYRWWEKVVSVEHFDSLQSITGVLVGEIGALPSVAEGAEYQELPVTDNPETGMWGKYGGYLPLTLELIDRDQVGKLKSYPRKLANAALRKISSLIADVFLSNSGLGPTMADGNTVFHANHGNLGSTALSSAEWEALGKAMFMQSMLVAGGETAPRLALDPRYLLVPRKLRLAAMQILYPQWERQATIFSENMQRGELGDVIVVPEFIDDTDWAAVADPRLAPAIYVGERFGLQPEIFISGDPLSPAMFTNDEARLKVRHFVSVFVADYRPLYKEIVTG
jgi:hypothetical protein